MRNTGNYKVVSLNAQSDPAQVTNFVAMMQRMYDFHATLHPDWQTKENWSERSAGWIKQASDGDEYYFGLAYPVESSGEIGLDQAAGYILASFHYEAPLFIQHRFGYIADLWVEPASRRQGVARLLLQSAYEWFRLQGVNRVQLEVDVNNSNGRRFWEGTGFEPFEIVMRKDI